ncbi:MAG: hypothetical protein ACFCD0_04055 [Gemmataceae bacterium]
MDYLENSDNNQNGPEVVQIPVWTYEQAESAIPYLTSVVSSIRDRFLAVQSARRTHELLAGRPGRPSRDDIIDHEHAAQELGKAGDEVTEAVNELLHLNIYSVDPVNGIAMIPFLHAEQLAWLVFELFEEPKVRSYRFHGDPVDKRRPLGEVLEAGEESTPIV